MAVTEQQIQALYIAYFNRPADVGGLAFQLNVANQAGLQAVADQFAKSPEYLALFANKGPVEVVDTIYLNLFGRHAEAAGIQFWATLLLDPTSGVTTGNAALSIFNGALNDDKVAVTNKLAAAGAFYNALDTPEEKTAYSGDTANAIAKTWMSGITTTASLTASTSPAVLDALTQTIVKGPGSTTGGTAGDDTVTITGTLGKGSIVLMGDGTDSVVVTTGVVTADAIVDGGNGVDTLSLAAVGSSNVGAFRNFENFDVAGAQYNFDTAILAANNTLTNLIGSGPANTAMTLSNLPTGVGFVVKGDMGTAHLMRLDQATPATLTITSDVDERAANNASATSEASFITNATGVKVVFDNANIDTLGDGFLNTARLDIATDAATAVNVVSGGAEVVNSLNYTDGLAALASITISGTQALRLHVDGGTGLTLVDASAQGAGGLKLNLAELPTTATIKLGAGDDAITLGAPGDFSAGNAVQRLSGFGLGKVEDATAQKGFDTLVFSGAVQAADHAGTALTYSIKDGLYTFGGLGPTTLDVAIAEINSHLAANEITMFQFGVTYYVYAQGASVSTADDQMIGLLGLKDVHGLDNITPGTIYLF